MRPSSSARCEISNGLDVLCRQQRWRHSYDSVPRGLRSGKSSLVRWDRAGLRQDIDHWLVLEPFALWTALQHWPV
jgi:hypothetical protein